MSDFRFSPAARVTGVRPMDVLEMMRRAAAMEASGRTVYRLVQGEPDFDTPAHIREAGDRAVAEGYTHYPPSEGYRNLRQAIAQKLQSENGVSYDPDTEILVTNGAGQGLHLAIHAVINPGDEILIPDPTYGAYASIAEAAGARVIRVPLRYTGSDWQLDLDELEKAVSLRTRAMILCSPDNPTGHLFSGEEIRALTRLVVERNIIMIADEVYERFVYDGPAPRSFPSLGPAVRERTILVNSFSKTYAMTGWRIGYNAAPAGMMDAMFKMTAVAGRGPAAFVQQAGVAALQGSQADVARMVAAYRERRDLAGRLLGQIPGIRFGTPPGGFYYFIDLSGYMGSSREMANWLTTEAGVVLAPGAYYGPSGEGWLRLSFCTSPATIEAGITTMAEALSRLKPGT